MADTIRVQMMGDFALYINEIHMEQMVNKSKKGVALMQLLILSGGELVPNQRILMTLWPDENTTNPENALKTLVSRTRTQLNQISPDLGKCIVADRGAYYWQSPPGMTVDVYDVEEIFNRLSQNHVPEDEQIRLSQRLLELYSGDLLQNSSYNEWALGRATGLHNKYMAAVYAYIELLKRSENHEEIVNVCRAALNVDNFDDRLHMEIMSALINTNRSNEALSQYKHVMHLHYRYLNIRPSDDLQEFYKFISNAGKTLEFNLESIRNELRESGERRGAFICEYAVFKEIYNLQMRNLERLGSTMFLAVIMIDQIDNSSIEPMMQENIMQECLEILKSNLRKGDTITRVNPKMLALLLPTVNYATGNLVMERIKRLFYKKFPNSNIQFNYRVGPLSSSDPAQETDAAREGK